MTYIYDAAGMLWTGHGPRAIEVEESMKSYFNMLVGFLLLSHGSTVGAGPTLSCFVRQAVQKIADCSYKLFEAPISSFGNFSLFLSVMVRFMTMTLWKDNLYGQICCLST